MLSQMLLDAIIIQERIVDIKQKDDVVPFDHVRSSLAPPKFFIAVAIKPKCPRRGSGGSALAFAASSALRRRRSNPVAVGSRAFDDAIAGI
jgi:hypothetical protein